MMNISIKVCLIYNYKLLYRIHVMINLKIYQICNIFNISIIKRPKIFFFEQIFFINLNILLFDFNQLRIF